jgi:hypothetical protein
MFYSQALRRLGERIRGEHQPGWCAQHKLVGLHIWDDPADRQYRTFLPFNKSRIPDNAIEIKVMLQFKQHSFVGSNPCANHGKVWADIKKGFFSNNPALVQSDFAASPSKNYAGYFVNKPSGLAYPIYRTKLKDTSFQYLNLTGITQFRQHFAIDDNNENRVDYL